MPEALMTVPEFCSRNRISRATFYNLMQIDRGPSIIRIGSRVLVSPEAETAWRERMAAEPVNAGIRRAASALAPAA